MLQAFYSNTKNLHLPTTSLKSDDRAAPFSLRDLFFPPIKMFLMNAQKNSEVYSVFKSSHWLFFRANVAYSLKSPEAKWKLQGFAKQRCVSEVWGENYCWHTGL